MGDHPINQIKPELRQTEPAQRRDRPSHGAERNPATQTGSYHNQNTQHHQPQNIQPHQHQRRTTPQSCTARRGLMGKRRHRPISRRNAPPNRSRTRHHLLPRTHHRPQMDTPRTRRTSLKWNNGASPRNTLVPMDATETQTMNTAQALANERSGQPCCNVATDVDRPNRPALLAQCRAISFWFAISASEVFRLTPVCKSGCCCCDLTALALPPSSRTRLRARSPWIGAASAVAAGFVAAEPAVAVP